MCGDEFAGVGSIHVLGVDPGVTGALALCRVWDAGLEGYGAEVVWVLDMPMVEDRFGVLPATRGGKNHRVVCATELRRELAVMLGCVPLLEQIWLVVERQQQTYRADGASFSPASGGFESGFNYAVLARAVLDFFSGVGEDRCNGAHFVNPRFWKTALGVPADKKASRNLASRIFQPKDSGYWSRVKDHGRAEAALMAFWRGKLLLSREKLSRKVVEISEILP